MTTRLYIPIILLMAFMCTALPACTAERITFDPASLTISQGDTGVITLTLDEAPKGLAGYIFRVTVSNPGTARIMDASYPPWAGLSDTTGTPGESITMSAVDLMRTIEPGAKNIVLGTISVQGGTAGSSEITIGEIQMDADGGDVISPMTSAGAITVSTDGIPVTWTTSPTTVGTTVPVTTTATTIPDTTATSSSGSSSSGDSGSGSSGGSLGGGGGSGSTVTSEITQVVTEATQMPAVTTDVQAAATPDVQAPVTTEVQVLSATPADTGTQAATSAQQQSPLPGSGSLPGGNGPAGIPWVFWGVVVILVMISLILLYLAVTKKI